MKASEAFTAFFLIDLGVTFTLLGVAVVGIVTFNRDLWVVSTGFAALMLLGAWATYVAAQEAAKEEASP